MNEALPDRSRRNITRLLFLSALLLFLPFGRGHFSGTDEVALFEMTRSMAERGSLDVGPLMHTETGRSGLRYSFFAVGQAVLALPLYYAADAARIVLPHVWQRALAGPRLRDSRHRYGGELEQALVCLYAPIATALLVALFFRFELLLGASLRSALIVSCLFATCSYALVMSTYFLRHSTVALAMLGAFYYFFRWREGGGTRELVIGAALASAIPLVRVPAAIVGPALATHLADAIYRRSDRLRDRRRALLALAAVLAPLALAAALHMLANHAKWGTLIESPMVGQRAEFSNPLWTGVRGYLFSPGHSVFVYSPLLLLTPFWLREFFRRWPAECIAFGLVLLACLLFHSKFDRWTGLWSAPGPRYLFLAVPLFMLPLGPWLDQGASRVKWMLLVPLASWGAFVQATLTIVEWARVPRLAGYPVEPDASDFLLDIDQSPVVVMAGLLRGGGPLDPWLARLWQGWDSFPGQPAAAIALGLLWATVFAGVLLLIHRECRSNAQASEPTRSPTPIR
jgi:hypothetical protein